MSINNVITVGVEVDQGNNNLIASVSLKNRNEIGVRYITTTDIEVELARQGWNVGECISKASLNNVWDTRLQAVWVFSLGSPRSEKPVTEEKEIEVQPSPKTTKTTKTTRTRRKRSTQKPSDK